VAFGCDADRLKIHALRPLKPRVLDAIRSHRAELLELLALESASRAVPHEYSCAPLESKTAAEWEAVAPMCRAL